jgi:hypothetical protein
MWSLHKIYIYPIKNLELKTLSKHHGKISDNLPKIDKSNGDSVIDYFLLKFDSNI